MIRKYIKLLLVAIVPLLTACSSDYVNVIPSGSTALMSFDVSAMSSNTDALKSLLKVDDISECGIKLDEKLYAFETADGSLGVVACVADAGDVEDWLNGLSKNGICTALTERKGCKFTVMRNSFVIGFSDNALLIMGPSVGAAQTELQRQMAKYLTNSEDEGIQDTKLFKQLETMNGPVALVAQAQALPDKLTAPLTLGAPKGTSPSDIYIAASFATDGNGVLSITGENFSFNTSVNNALKKATSQYKPISGKYVSSIPQDALLSLICGVNGMDYIKLLRNNDAFRTMLAGLNTAIDIDIMLKSIKGDILITVPTITNDKIDFQLVADADNRTWLADVPYWKSSCPEGTKITDWKTANTFHFTSTDWNVYFGLLIPKRQLFFGSSEELASSVGQPATNPLPANVQKEIVGNRLCLIVGMDALAKKVPESKVALDILKPLFGDIKTIIYQVK